MVALIVVPAFFILVLALNAAADWVYDRRQAHLSATTSPVPIPPELAKQLMKDPMEWVKIGEQRGEIEFELEYAPDLTQDYARSARKDLTALEEFRDPAIKVKGDEGYGFHADPIPKSRYPDVVYDPKATYDNYRHCQECYAKVRQGGLSTLTHFTPDLRIEIPTNVPLDQHRELLEVFKKAGTLV